MTQEVLKQMYQLLLTEPHAPTVCAQLERIAREALADHAMRETQRLGQEIEQAPVSKYCCRLCFNKSGSLLLDRMILCSECGNKRCPKATNHELHCTDSNAPNQAGSIYNTPPQRTEQEPVAIKRMKEWIEYLKRKSDFGQHMKIPSEMSAGACWELAIELEQFINTTPPQRTWVELTAEEVLQCWEKAHAPGNKEHINAIRMADEVEAKLKEKNCG